MSKLIRTANHLRNSVYKKSRFILWRDIYNKLTTYKAESELAIAKIKSSTPSRERMAFPTRDGPWKTNLTINNVN